MCWSRLMIIIVCYGSLATRDWILLYIIHIVYIIGRVQVMFHSPHCVSEVISGNFHLTKTTHTHFFFLYRSMTK